MKAAVDADTGKNSGLDGIIVKDELLVASVQDKALERRSETPTVPATVGPSDLDPLTDEEEAPDAGQSKKRARTQPAYFSLDNPLVLRHVSRFDRTPGAKALRIKVESALHMMGDSRSGLGSLMEMVPYRGDQIVICAAVAEYCRALTSFAVREKAYVYVRNTFSWEWRHHGKKLTRLKYTKKRRADFKVISPLFHAQMAEGATGIKASAPGRSATSTEVEAEAQTLAEESKGLFERAKRGIRAKEAEAQEARAKAMAKLARLKEARGLKATERKAFFKAAFAGSAKSAFGVLKPSPAARPHVTDGFVKRARKKENRNELAHLTETREDFTGADARNRIEMIRLFEPGVYDAVMESLAAALEPGHEEAAKSNGRGRAKAREEEEENRRADVVRLAGLSSEENREAVRFVLQDFLTLFNCKSTAASNDGGANGSKGLDLEPLLAQFRVSVAKDLLTPEETLRLLKGIRNRRSLTRVLEGFDAQSKLDVAVQVLQSFVRRMDLCYAESVLTALFDISESFFRDDLLDKRVPPHWTAEEMVFQILRKTPDKQARGKLLRDSIEKTDALFFPIHITSALVSELESGPADNMEALLGERDITDLKQAILQRIRESSQNTALCEHAKLYSILFRWKILANPIEPQLWVEELLEKPEGVVALVTSFLAQDSRDAGRIWIVNLAKFEPFVDLAVLARKVDSLILGNLPEKSLNAVRSFKQAYREFLGNDKKEFQFDVLDLA